MFESVNEPNGVIFYHRGLGDIAFAREDKVEAYRQFKLSLQHARRVNFIWGATYALAGLGRAALALGEFEAAHAHLTEALDSAISTRDSGLALFVLAGWADLYAHNGQTQQAVEICSLVAGHFAAWRETKAQAPTLLNSLGDLPLQPLAVAQGRGHHNEVWDLADRLLQRDLKPA